MSDLAIHCSDVTLRFKNGPRAQNVLDNLSLSVARGQTVSLLGPSGCGKSTLLRVVAGLIEPTKGDVQIQGQPPHHSRSRLSFIFQEAALLPWRTVWQNVQLPRELKRQPATTEWRAAMHRVLHDVGFQESDWKKMPAQLSGGMKMRASIARALITDPEILLLDEPFAALDDMLRSKLNDLLLSIAAAASRTMLFVTHNIAEAIYLSHSIAIMSRGHIAEVIEVPLAFPRTNAMRSTLEFAQFYGHVSERLARSQQ